MISGGFNLPHSGLSAIMKVEDYVKSKALLQRGFYIR